MKPRPRPDVTEGQTYCINTGCGSLYVTINEDDKGLCEVFVNLAKSGSCQSAQNETMGRLISICLRAGVDVEEILDMLKDVRCSRPLVGNALSCSDGVARALLKHINGDEGRKEVPLTCFENNMLEFCPECNVKAVVHEEGCKKCHSCGWSDCS